MTYPDPPPGTVPYAAYSTGGPAYDRDADHIKILAILHYVWGGLTLLLSCFGIFYVVIGLVLATNANSFLPTPAPPPAVVTPTTGPATPGGFTYTASPQPPPAIGYIMAGFGGCFVLAGWTIGTLTIVSGVKMTRRRSRTFSLVVAGLNCISVPVGTTLGVFTFVVLLRPTVREAYAIRAAAE